jgi:hypothetical protein
MASCERGYLCQVCGKEVESITDSELYLRYVLDEVKSEQLNRSPERHIRCVPVTAQFIVLESFPPVEVSGPFSKSSLDPEHVRAEEARITAGYQRLIGLSAAGLGIFDYPIARAEAECEQ